ncbi:TRAP transporter large permease [Limibacillus halophilus]|uniref:TRAP transporter large permease protein n=1 Tax=Limibacillus halophilus TaxID=1579333 RepID=A0A839ST09_9PROT|nr:TRAP transporter large permease subunit [Limibacillus halophilus]MBB3065997.1 tripartite ATP-independent transporter DctM subunit [Limibacillus halophilus]
MPVNEIFAILLLVFTGVFIMFGFPVAFTLAGVSILMALAGSLFGVFDFFFYSSISARYFGIMTNEVLVAIPLFVFMGVMLERSKIAEALLTTMGQAFGAVRGGIGISVTLVGMLLAAATGIVGATVVTMGLLSLPTMLRAGYDKKLAVGVICASGTLGQIIPPSIALVILGDALAGVYTESQLAKGNFIFEPFSVIDLFAGALLPGLMLVGFYVAWLVFLAIRKPEVSPAFYDQDVKLKALLLDLCSAMLPPCLLVLAVLGSIIGGLATPTEAASFGGVGATILAAAKGQLSWDLLRSVSQSTVKITCMVFGILLGASIFSLTFRGFGGDALVHHFLTGLPGGFTTAMLIVMVVIFLLGFILDFIEIVFIVVPIVAPALFHADISPVWLGVMIAVNLQTSFLTPPFGWALFYVRAVAPPSIRTTEIYRGVMPFVAIQLIALGVLWLYPDISTWLPRVLFN